MNPKSIIPAAKRLLESKKHLLYPSRWEKLTKENKRKAVLLDAIKQILVEFYIPCSLYDEYSIYGRKGSVQKLLLNKELETCECCQRGMLLLSAVKFNNNVSVNEYKNIGQYSLELKSGLEELVSYSERNSMESAFEGYLKGKTQRDFYMKYHTTRRNILAIAIFLNAYKYGVFSPKEWL